MTHFDFKCLLPALLHVEDRMSMAHGLESRVPLLDHPLVEFAATAPADVKFAAGNTKHLLKRAWAMSCPTPSSIAATRWAFPFRLRSGSAESCANLSRIYFDRKRPRSRPYFNGKAVPANFDRAGRFRERPGV